MRSAFVSDYVADCVAGLSDVSCRRDMRRHRGQIASGIGATSMSVDASDVGDCMAVQVRIMLNCC